MFRMNGLKVPDLKHFPKYYFLPEKHFHRSSEICTFFLPENRAFFFDEKFLQQKVTKNFFALKNDYKMVKKFLHQGTISI